MKRLIVVADNSLIVEAIRTGMRETGAFELVGYADARKASARMIAETGVDLVLMDEADRSQEALDLIRSIKEQCGDVTIIILTVRMDGEWLARALETGASGAISKSVHPAALATLVREALNGHIVHSLASVGSEPAPPQPADGNGHSPLTDRELQILQLVASGATNGDIARRLWITQQTVKFHVSNIYRKLAVANRTEACHYAHVHGMVVPGEEVRVGVFASVPAAPPGRREPRFRPAGDSHAGERRLQMRARVGPGTA
jgi:DNA-binding NarL/FixJ family response regulator